MIETTQHDTKGKITEPFTVYLYEAVKLTFKTGIELLKNGEKISTTKINDDTKSINMRKHSGNFFIKYPKVPNGFNTIC